MADNPSRYNRRLDDLVSKTAIPADKPLMLDCYNQKVYDDIVPAVTTRIDQCNHYWICLPKR